VLELLQKSGISDIKVKRLGIPDEFVTHGEQGLLRSLYHLDAEGIAQECVDFLADSQPKTQGESIPPVLPTSLH
jgi:1-deoxy-D-xylulose-5-phosphate synthase